LYLINGAMTKLQDAGAFANTNTTETEETSDGPTKTGSKSKQVPRQGA
ncbi:MAG: phage portal protein, partial [Clostridia bacterium]|nr:phage portal protein [Clostridia bacterium]